MSRWQQLYGNGSERKRVTSSSHDVSHALVKNIPQPSHNLVASSYQYNCEHNEKDDELEKWMKQIQLKAENDAMLEFRLRTATFSKFESAESSTSQTCVQLEEDDREEQENKNIINKEYDSEIKRRTQQVLSDISNRIDQTNATNAQSPVEPICIRPCYERTISPSSIKLNKPKKTLSPQILHENAMICKDDVSSTGETIDENTSLNTLKLHEFQEKKNMRIKVKCLRFLSTYFSTLRGKVEKYKLQWEVIKVKRAFRVWQSLMHGYKVLVGSYIDHRNFKLKHKCFNMLMKHRICVENTIRVRAIYHVYSDPQN